jgi:hypothetical protein
LDLRDPQQKRREKKNNKKKNHKDAIAGSDGASR